MARRTICRRHCNPGPGNKPAFSATVAQDMLLAIVEISMYELPLPDGRSCPAHFPEPEETVVTRHKTFVARCLHHCRDLQNMGNWIYGEPLVTTHPIWGKILRIDFCDKHEYFASSPWTQCMIVWQMPGETSISGTCLTSRKHPPPGQEQEPRV